MDNVSKLKNFNLLIIRKFKLNVLNKKDIIAKKIYGNANIPLIWYIKKRSNILTMYINKLFLLFIKCSLSIIIYISEGIKNNDSLLGELA